MVKLMYKYRAICILVGLILFNIIAITYEQYKENETVFLINDSLEKDIEQESIEAINEVSMHNEDRALEARPVETLVEIPVEIPVYVSGAVKVPDVYYVPTGTILQTAIQKAGGFLDDADLNAINLARQVQAHEQIYIPKIGEKIDKSSYSYDNSNSEDMLVLININEANKESLNMLPGIGDVKAQHIIDYREAHGFFSVKEEIQNVQGIGEKTYLLIENRITTE